MKIKKGDVVVVTSGKDRGKEGKVLRAFPKKDTVLVEGIQVVSRHQKSRKRGSQGQIVQKPMPIRVSNIALKDAKTGKAVRIGYKIEDGKKIRVARPDGMKI
jgi:large subunit ribosomal protein L24